MPGICRVGDQGSHNGTNVGSIITGLSSVKTNNLDTAYVGSEYNCPAHGVNSISSSPSKVKIGNNFIAVIGSTTVCGATITQGSSNTTA